MDILVPAVIAAIVSLIVAVVGVMSTRYSTRFSADLELAKFRVEWIQRLRDTLAEFQSYAMLPNFEPHGERKFYELGTKIELLLNREDPLYEKLQNIMYDMLAVSVESVEKKYTLNPEFIAISQDILKQEWEVAKKEMQKKRKYNA